MIRDLSVIDLPQAELGEGPFWYEGALYWTDIVEHKIHRYFPNNNKFEEKCLSFQVGAFAPREKGGFIIAADNGFYFLSDFDGIITPILNTQVAVIGNRFNDGKCDSLGRFWAGTMSLSGIENQGTLYMLDLDLKVTKKYSPVSISNGICWSLDNKEMYYIDTPTRQVIVFDFDLDSGEINNPKPLLTVKEDNGLPDGMTIDSNGCLWIALWGGGAVICFDPKSKRVLDKIELPTSQVSSCTFGGADLNDLYITTAKAGLREENEPLAGSIFRLKLDVKGFPVSVFNG